MLIFTNPGLIDLAAITTLGVSVKQPGSFGRFGTGLKFAIATILRGGGEVILYRGEERWEFRTHSTMIRDQEFQLIDLHNIDRTNNQSLNSRSLGITTQLGRDWEPWMVLRELGCNALDEHGSFTQSEDDHYFPYDPTGGTTFYVRGWQALEDAYEDRHSLFLAPLACDPLFVSPELRILTGTSPHIYYRGVRVLSLPYDSAFTYDLLGDHKLTEDRTLANLYEASKLIGQTLVQMTDRQIIRKILSETDSYEFNEIDYDWQYSHKPSREFIDEALNLRAQHHRLNDSVRDILLRSMRSGAEENSNLGSYRRALDDRFQYAIDILDEIKITFPANQAFVQVEELPNESMLTMLESGRVYYTAALLDQPARKITEELLMRWAEINVDGYDMQAMAKLLTPLILRQSSTLRDDEQLISEDESLMKMANLMTLNPLWIPDRAETRIDIGDMFE